MRSLLPASPPRLGGRSPRNPCRINQAGGGNERVRLGHRAHRVTPLGVGRVGGALEGRAGMLPRRAWKKIWVGCGFRWEEDGCGTWEVGGATRRDCEGVVVYERRQVPCHRPAIGGKCTRGSGILRKVRLDCAPGSQIFSPAKYSLLCHAPFRTPPFSCYPCSRDGTLAMTIPDPRPPGSTAHVHQRQRPTQCSAQLVREDVISRVRPTDYVSPARRLAGACPICHG